jgi:glycerophosphoryl diester phosphodiesterase
MICWGHRGCKGPAIENTMEAFEAAFEVGAHGIELDVQLSAEGIPVVVHDDSPARTHGLRGFVHTIDAQTLNLVGIPTLEAVLSTFWSKGYINIEIKNPEATAAVVQLIQKYYSVQAQQEARVLVSSFHEEVLQTAFDMDPNIALGILTASSVERAMELAHEIQVYAIHPAAELCSAIVVDQIQAAGYKVFPWTVNEPEHMMTLKQWGVDGLITDEPKLCLETLHHG